MGIRAGDREGLSKIAAICQQCGIAFETYKLYRLRRKCCSDACAKRCAGLKRRQSCPAIEHTCRGCGAVFVRKVKAKNTGQFHSRECFFAWFTASSKKQQRKMAIIHDCQGCGQRLENARLGKSYCSAPCRETACRRADLANREPRTCSECAVPFVPEYTHRLVCGRRCQFRRAKRLGKASGALKKHRKAYKRLRRARLDGARIAERVHAQAVFQRDGWRCALCGVRTPRHLQGLMVDRAPELDHIIPLSKGGSHTYENVQCACRKCNGLKGNKPLGQLRLVG